MNGDGTRHGARRAILGAATLVGALAGVVFLFDQMVSARMDGTKTKVWYNYLLENQNDSGEKLSE